MLNWLVSYKKKKKLFTRVNCVTLPPFKTFMLTICSTFNIKGNFT